MSSPKEGFKKVANKRDFEKGIYELTSSGGTIIP